jgi:Helix-turn-helix domain
MHASAKVPLLQTSPADDKATFLAEFRALRDRAAIDYDELAARTHFPTDLLKDAESGPDLPGLPVLAAYVRACGGDASEWEERWRRLDGADHHAGLPTRPAGASPAAKAGARAGVSVAPAEVHDPERIKAALRAHRERKENADRPGSAVAPNGAGGNGVHAGAGTGTMLASEKRTVAETVRTHGTAQAAPSHAAAPAVSGKLTTGQVPAGSVPKDPLSSRAAGDPGGARQVRLLVLAVIAVILACVLALMFT